MSDIKDRTLTIKRTLQVPLKLAWEAWTRSEHITLWWGSKGMKTKVLEHDLRIGGKWEYIMLMPDGIKFTSEGT